MKTRPSDGETFCFLEADIVCLESGGLLTAREHDHQGVRRFERATADMGGVAEAQAVRHVRRRAAGQVGRRAGVHAARAPNAVAAKAAGHMPESRGSHLVSRGAQLVGPEATMCEGNLR